MKNLGKRQASEYAGDVAMNVYGRLDSVALIGVQETLGQKMRRQRLQQTIL